MIFRVWTNWNPVVPDVFGTLPGDIAMKSDGFCWFLCSPGSLSKPPASSHREPLSERPERSQPEGAGEDGRQAMDVEDDGEKKKPEKKKITQQKFFTIQVRLVGQNSLSGACQIQQDSEMKRE